MERRLFDDSSKSSSAKKDNPASPFERVRTFSIYEKRFQYTHASRSSDQHVSTRCDVNFDLRREEKTETEIRCVLCAQVCSYGSRVTHYRADACSTFRPCCSKFVSTWRQVTRGDEKIICIFLREPTMDAIGWIFNEWELENNKPRKSCLGASIIIYPLLCPLYSFN